MSIAETISPTKERLRQIRTGVDAPAVDRHTSRSAYRILPLVEQLYRQGKVSEHCFKHYRRFEDDWNAARFYPSRVCKYGSQSSSTTPLHQMTEQAMDAAEAQVERRLFAAERLRAARDAIGGMALQAIEMAVEQNVSLEDIGKAIFRYSGKMQSQAVGMILIHDALNRLHEHYEPG